MKFYILHGTLTDRKDGVLPAWKRPTLTAGISYTFEFDGEFPAGNYVLAGDIDFERENVMMKSSKTLKEPGTLSFDVSTDTEGFWQKPRFTGEKLYIEIIRDGEGIDGKVEPILKDYVYCTPRVAGDTDDPNALHVNWGDIVDKPSEFTPKDHIHELTDVTGLTDQDGKLAYNCELVNQPTKWSEIPDKPENFTPESHTHTESEITDLHKHLNKTDLDMIGVYQSDKGTATFKNMDNGGKIEFTNTAKVTSNISLTDGSDNRHVQIYSHDPNGGCTRIAINPTGAFYADTNGNDFDEGNKIARIKDLKNATIVLTEDQKRDLKGEPGERGADGTDGKDGENGVTFTPSVSEAGVLSWTNNGSLSNPPDVTIKGERGEPGTPGQPGKDGKDGAKGEQGDPGPANVLTVGDFEFVETEEEGEVTIDGTSPSQTLHFKIPKGPKGDRGEAGLPGAAGTNGTDGTDGKDAGFGEITAKAEIAEGNEPSVVLTTNGTPQQKTLDFTFKIPRGEKGENGAAGADGQQGPQGDPGKDAKIGNVTVSIVPIETEGTPTGSAAVTDGTDGTKDIAFTLQLPKGDKGEAGNPGKDGVQGDRGEDGTDGKSAGFGTPTIEVKSIDYNAEATGSVTADGDDTAKAFHFKFDIPKGEPGATGERGPAGPAGTNGTDGKDGQPGKDAKIGDASAEVEMTAPDGEAAVVVTSTEDTGAGKTFHFKFTLPKGEKGDDGTPGAPGQNGAKGSDGTDGKDAKIGSVTAKAEVAENGTPAVEIKATPSTSDGETNTTDFEFTFKIPKGEKGDAGPKGEDGAPGAQGPQGEEGQPGAQGPAGPDGQPGKDGQNGKDAPKHVLLFTCPESENGLHLEVTYRELNNGGGEEETYQKLVNTTEESDRSKVKGNHGGLNWVECPKKGFGSVFGGWPVLVDLSQIEAIDVSKIYSIRYRWIANSGTGAAEPAMASEEAGTGTDGIASDWYAMIYPCATEAPVSSNPGAALPQIADMQDNSVLFFSKGKYTALTIEELKKLINGTGTSS